jgi:hypothetical protein
MKYGDTENSTSFGIFNFFQFCQFILYLYE